MSEDIFGFHNWKIQETEAKDATVYRTDTKQRISRLKSSSVIVEMPYPTAHIHTDKNDHTKKHGLKKVN
jgi:hypothetical protein